jgi:hypothetical protein
MVNKLCRLCATEKERGFEIYQAEGLKLNLSSKIIRCLQIRVGCSLTSCRMQEQVNIL